MHPTIQKALIERLAPGRGPTMAQLVEATRAAKAKRVDRTLRNQFATSAKKHGLDGNGRFDRVGKAISAAFDILSKYGIESGGSIDAFGLKQDSGSRRFDMAWTNPEDSFSPIPISNSYLSITWQLMDNNKFEVVAYLS